MKIIDSHVHLGKWLTADFFGRELTAEALFSSMEKFGINGSVVMPTDAGDNEAILSSLKRFPTVKWRFLPWIKPDGGKTLEFCKKHINDIAGFKFHPSFDKKRITDPSFKEFFKLAAQYDLPLVVHCGRWEEMAGSRFPIEVAESDGKLKVVLSHMGGDTPSLAFKTIEAIKEKGLKNVYLDTAGFREYWVIEKGVKELGASHFLFASDFPLGHPKAGQAIIENLDIEDEDKKRILCSNAERLFRWGD